MTDDQGLPAARAAGERHDWTAVRALLRAAPELGDDDLELLASACWWVGEMDEYAVASAELHRRLLADGQPVRAALVAFELGYTEVVRGRQESGTGWMARARRLFDEQPEAPERGFVLAVDAELAMVSGDLGTAGALAEQTLALGQEHDLPTLVALGRFLCGVVAVHRGETEHGLRCIDEAMLPVQAGEVAPEWVGLLYCDTIQLCHDLLDLVRAQRWTTLTERWCHGHAPAVLFAANCRVHQAQLRVVRGEWDQAEDEARSAAADLEDLDVALAAEAHYSLGELHRLRGDLDAAEQAYRRAHGLGRDPLPGLALLSLHRGRRQVAASILDAALATQTLPLMRAPLLTARIEVALADGGVEGPDPAGAAPYLAELAAIAEECAGPGWRAEALRWRGSVQLAQGEPAEAVRDLRRAAAMWQEMGAPYQVCRIGPDLATAYEALGDRDTARRERELAAAVLESLGAPPAPPAPRDLDGLTERELEVLGRVADGDSNRQAARTLHISESTVARHLANVYLKTRTSSRTAAAAWARERGLLG